MFTSRRWRVALLTLVLMVAVPMWQLSNHSSALYYRQQAQDLYENVSNYFTHEQELYNNTLYQYGNEGKVHAQFNFSTPCEGFPNTDNILLVMKTGASETYSKLPTQLLTTMSCLPDFLLFSDLEKQIGKYHVHNALDRVDKSVMKANEEFQLYEEQLRCPISQEECFAGQNMHYAWNLDRYKFLNMIERTWEKRPNMDWYVFAEADTYIVWSNIVPWLRESAPKGDAYVGSVAMLEGFTFAHGGSGYVMSGSLLKKMVEDVPNIAAKYDQLAGEECCGDILLAKGAAEAGTTVQQALPMFNGEKPNTLPYGPGHWCEPILTMHHVNSEDVSMIWQFEQTRKDKSEILRIKDMYEAFVAPHLVDLRLDWDNMSEDTCYIGPSGEEQENAGEAEKWHQMPEEQKNTVERRAHLSPATCSKVCEADGIDIPDNEYVSFGNEVERGHFIQDRLEKKVFEDSSGDFRRSRSCFQWRYSHGVCCTSKSFKLGKPRREPGDAKWTSGWFVRGIQDWVHESGNCNEVKWQTPY